MWVDTLGSACGGQGPGCLDLDNQLLLFFWYEVFVPSVSACCLLLSHLCRWPDPSPFTYTISPALTIPFRPRAQAHNFTGQSLALHFQAFSSWLPWLNLLWYNPVWYRWQQYNRMWKAAPPAGALQPCWWHCDHGVLNELLKQTFLIGNNCVAPKRRPGRYSWCQQKLSPWMFLPDSYIIITVRESIIHLSSTWFTNFTFNA